MAVIDGRQVEDSQYAYANVIEVQHLDSCEDGCADLHQPLGTPYSTGGTLPPPPKGSLAEAIARLHSARDEATVRETTWGSTNSEAGG